MTEDLENAAPQELSDEEKRELAEKVRRESEIVEKLKLASWFENLKHSAQTEAGKIIIGEIRSQLNDLRNMLFNSLLSGTKEPFDEVSLILHERLRSQITAFEALEKTFTIEFLEPRIQITRKEAELLQMGAPLDPAY